MALPTLGATSTNPRLAEACAELGRRLRAGSPAPAGDVLREYPDLAADRNAVLELIYTEYVLREERGERTAPEDWYARFPEWAADLRDLFQVNAQVRAEPSQTATTLPDGRSSSAPT